MEWNFKGFTLTARELIVSVVIIAMFLMVGIFIHSKISDSQMYRNEAYNKALKIDDAELFKYGMQTNVGQAFVNGDLTAVDTVTYPEIGGEYMYVKKIKERHTQHTRTVTRTRTVNGKSSTYITTETYWSWDKVGSEEKRCSEVMFCGVQLPANKIILPEEDFIITIRESSSVRYKYYGTGIKFNGTLFTTLKDNTISDNSAFYPDCSIDDTVNMLSKSYWGLVFWIVWVLIMLGVVFAFFYAENRWLE